MIKRAMNRLKELSTSQRIVLCVDVVIPVILQSLQHWIDIGAAIILPIYGGWVLITVLSLAWMISDDKNKAEQSVDQKIADLSTEIKKVQEDQKRWTKGLQSQLDDVNKVMRSAFEKLGVTLPPPVISLSGNIRGGEARISGKLTVTNQGKIRRFRLWGKHQIVRFWHWFYG